MKKLVLLPLAVVFAYAAYPYGSLYRLGEALDIGDEVGLKRHVDWTAVRGGLEEDLSDTLSGMPGMAIASHDDEKAFSGLLASEMRSELVGPLVDAIATPEGLAAVIRQGRAGQGSPAADGQSGGTPNDHNTFGEHLSFAFFTGPFTFEAVFENEKGEDVIAMMRLNDMRWQLVRLRLPDIQALAREEIERVAQARASAEAAIRARDSARRLTAQLVEVEATIATIRERMLSVEQSIIHAEKIEVRDPQYYWTDDGDFSQPVVEFVVRNNLDVALTAIFFEGVLRIPGSPLRQIDERFDYRFRVGLKPGQEQRLRLGPPYGDLYDHHLKSRTDTVLSLRLVDAETASGNRIADGSGDESDRLQVKLEELEKVRNELRRNLDHLGIDLANTS
jgi:hypothetical protein